METAQMTEPELDPQEFEGGWEQPNFGIISMPNALTGKQLIGLQVTTSSTLNRFYLCDTSNYEQVARELHKQIMDAGVQSKRTESGLIVAGGGVPDGLVRKAQGGQQRRPRG